MIDKLEEVDDQQSADILKVIYRDEIGHVATGRRWFEYICQERELEPRQTWRNLVEKHFRGALKPPLNNEGRLAADFPPEYYQPLIDESDTVGKV